MWDELLVWIATPEGKVAVPVFTFIAGGVGGFLARSFTSTPSERKQHRQRLFENGVKHMTQRIEKYRNFINAMQTCAQKKKAGEPLSLDDFLAVATTGDIYFAELKIACTAVLGGSMDDGTIREISTAAVEATAKILPLYYETLGKMASQIGSPYDGKLKRFNYEAIYEVAEKFAPTSVMPRIRLIE
ncbi:hypothetical protein G6L67_07665 [Agrobacterium tumefaciens]|uniref:hypothetical protein n=1 Tax=Agrobacterium tumefaciens TaxID=358 RepID=UPI000EF56A4B|nr:hypothetical protein [Agrobacterium tumefaciens]AYM81037.1 hypothetical protein At12D1_11500 [Agrobacterium tumefaciens]NTE91727.1 hypothetical protein [Agrobacterium tumefaciens]